MSNGPLPSNMCLLSSLPSRTVGDKVRFLGCVTSYATASGILTLEHRHPADPAVAALVDVRLLLESLSSGQTSIGEWALVLWSAGPLDIKRYETCLDKIEDEPGPLDRAEKGGR